MKHTLALITKTASRRRRLGAAARRGWLAWTAVVVASLAVAAGCGRRDMGRVSGTVTFKGQPVAKAIIRFQPPQRPMGAGQTNAAGRFAVNTLAKGDGAFQGACIVTVVPVAEFVEGSIEPKPRPDIPERYRSNATTPFKAEVVAGKANEFTFDMKD